MGAAGKGARYFRVRRRPDANQKPILDALKKAGIKVFDLSGVGHGCPDLATWNGKRIVLLEVKTEKGDLEDSQERSHQEWPVIVVRSITDALKAVGVE